MTKATNSNARSLEYRGSTPRWGSGGVFVGGDRSAEVKENYAQVGFGPPAGIWLELGLHIDDEGETDRGERTSLRTLLM